MTEETQIKKRLRTIIPTVLAQTERSQLLAETLQEDLLNFYDTRQPPEHDDRVNHLSNLNAELLSKLQSTIELLEEIEDNTSILN